MDVIEAIHSRRSIRAYTVESVARPLIEAIIRDAAQAPPPFAGQVPWTFNVIEGAARVAACGEKAWHYAHAHRPDGPGWSWLDREDFLVFWNAPAIVIISGPLADCCRAGQNLMLSAHARGLGTCWVGAPMLWLQTADARAELGIPEAFTPASAICLGYPAAIPEAVPHPPPPIIWSSD